MALAWRHSHVVLTPAKTRASTTHASEEAQYAQGRVLRPLAPGDLKAVLGLNRPSRRELTDEQIHERLRKLRDAGVNAIGDVLKQFATYDGVTAERVRAVVASHGANSMDRLPPDNSDSNRLARTVQSAHG
jgi:hypothetical protein